MQSLRKKLQRSYACVFIDGYISDSPNGEDSATDAEAEEKDLQESKKKDAKPQADAQAEDNDPQNPKKDENTPKNANKNKGVNKSASATWLY